MKKGSIKLAIFDMAGTTINDNNYVAKIFVQSFKEYNIPISIDDANAVMGYEKQKAITQILKQHSRKIDKILVSKIHKYFIKQCHEFYKKNAKATPFTENTFKLLRKNEIKIALNSGFDRSIVDIIIKKLGWAVFIDYSIASNEVTKGRPHSHMIRSLKKMAGISNNKSIAKIGDTPVDLLEGSNAKCGLNIAIRSIKYAESNLSIYPHTHIVKNIKEATSIILNHEF